MSEQHTIVFEIDDDAIGKVLEGAVAQANRIANDPTSAGVATLFLLDIALQAVRQKLDPIISDLPELIESHQMVRIVGTAIAVGMLKTEAGHVH